MKDKLKNLYTRLRWKGNHRYFCISMQRTGTTSVGKFLTQNGIPTANWSLSHSRRWSAKWYENNFDAIFNDPFFIAHQGFEDNPWWYPNFYKQLYHRFPNAKFILFTRDSKKWFQSMKSHSNGKNPGNTIIHAKIYNRQEEFNSLLNKKSSFTPKPIEEVDNLLTLEGFDDHYIRYYENRNNEVIEFFNEHDKKRLFHTSLEHPNKWKDLSKFIGVPYSGEKYHENKSN